MTATPGHSATRLSTDAVDDRRWLILLGICPLLGATVSLLSGLALGLAVLAMLCAISTLIAASGARLSADRRLAATLVLAAGLAAVIGGALQAWLFPAWLLLGATVPVLVANAGIVVQADAAAQTSPFAALGRAAHAGVRIVALLAILGTLRELIGRGTLFAGADLFGERTSAFTAHLLSAGSAFALAAAPAGGFLLLGLLAGLRNALALRRAAARGAA
jgi:electron transport complex protein RnfE